MPDSTITVALVTRFVPAYRMPVLKALADRIGGRLGIACGEPPKASSLRALTPTGSEPLPTVRINNHWVWGEQLYWQSFRHVFREWPSLKAIIIEENPRSLSHRFLMRAARRRGIAVILWGHFASNHRDLHTSHWRNRARLRVAGRADALIAYTDLLADSLKEVLPGQAVFTARNTLDTDVLFPIGDALMAEGRASIRERLSLSGEPLLLFIGRLIPEKRVDAVMDVAARLKQDGRPDLAVVVIGDGPERERIEQRAGSLGIRVHMPGAMADLEASAPWIAACDVLVNPGYLGLSVNHAFSLGVPVVAPAPGAEQDGPGHSPEWSYVRSGENGILARNGSVEALAEATAQVLDDEDGFSGRAAAFAREHLSLSVMVRGLVDAIEHVAPDAVNLS